LIKLINLTAMHSKGLDLISDCFWCVQAQPFGQINGIAAPKMEFAISYEEFRKACDGHAAQIPAVISSL